MYPFSLKKKITLVVFLLISAVVSAVAGLGLLFFTRDPALSSFTGLSSTGWILAAQLPLAEAYAPIDRARRLVELSLDGILLLVERRFVFINPAGCELLGAVTQEEFAGEAAP